MTDDITSKGHPRPNGRFYAANAFGPPNPGTPLAGSLEVDLKEVRFVTEQNCLELPLMGLKLEMGGWDLNQAVLTHPDRAGWSVYVTDGAFLNDPILAGHPGLNSQAKAAGRKRGGGNKIWVLAVALSLVFITPVLLLVLNRGRLARALAEKVPVEWERQLGEQAFGQVRAKGDITDDPEALAKLKSITTPLVKGISETRFALQFHFSRDTNINAFALPGGHVVVNAGLINAARRPEEIAGVLAHEIAHVTQRHGIRSLIESAGLSLMFQAVAGDQSGLLGSLTSGSQFLLQKKYSRDFEREADDVGWEYLVKAKIDPRGMIDFFVVLKDLEKKNAALSAMNGALNFASTHPGSQERIDRLEAKAKAMSNRNEFVPLK